ncbi:MAG TPA: plasmid mobilization relaxosome protein MobC [Flavobacterium sp.]
MMKEKDNRTKWLHLRLTPDEYQKIIKEFDKSTCRKISDYARKNLLQKPIVNTYRNQSLDDFMAEMIRLRMELNAIGNNFNQAVKKLHTLHQIADFKHWLISYELEKKILFNKVDEIKKHIQKFAESWLQ